MGPRLCGTGGKGQRLLEGDRYLQRQKFPEASTVSLDCAAFPRFQRPQSPTSVQLGFGAFFLPERSFRQKKAPDCNSGRALVNVIQYQ